MVRRTCSRYALVASTLACDFCALESPLDFPGDALSEPGLPKLERDEARAWKPDAEVGVISKLAW